MLTKHKFKLITIIIVYIGIIFIFSFIYYKMPNKSFFHSTVKYDIKYMQNDTTLVLKEIDDAIRDDIKSNISKIDNYLTIEELSAKNLNIKEYPNNVIVNFSVKYKYSKEYTILQGLNYKVHLDMSNYIKMNSKEYIYFTVDNNKIMVDPKIFPTIDGNSVFRTNDINISANYLTLNNEIEN